MPLPDKRQCLRAVQGLHAGGEVGAREWLVHGLVQTHGHAADGVGEQNETEQADLREVVHLDPGEVCDRVNQAFLTSAGDLLLQFLPLGHPLFLNQLFALVGGVRPVDTVDFEVAVSLVVDVCVARDGDCGCLGAVFRDADDHDRVSVDFAVGHASVQALKLFLAQRVALRIRARVRADKQDVHCAVERVVLALGSSHIEFGGRQLPAEAADGEVADTGQRDRGGGKRSEYPFHHRVAGLRHVAGSRRCRLDVAGAPAGVSHAGKYTTSRHHSRSRCAVHRFRPFWWV